MEGNGFKIFSLVALIALSLLYLWPTVGNALNERELAAKDSVAAAAYVSENYDELQETREKALNLGLDLQGGMHVTLEVGAGTLLTELAEGRTDDVFTAAIQAANQEAKTSSADYVTLFAAAVEAERADTRLARYFRDTDAGINARSSNAEVQEYLRAEVTEALARAVQIIRQRVDRFGVTEPSIQQQGGSRIAVELPGVDDPQRVRDLLRGTAKLTFHLTPTYDELQATAARLLQHYAGEAPAETVADTAEVAADSTAATDTDADTTGAVDLGDALAGDTPTTGDGGNRLAELLRLPGYPAGTVTPIFGQVAERDTAEVMALINAPEVAALVPPGIRLLYTARAEGETEDGEEVFTIVGVNSRVELDGEVITDANPDFDAYTNAPLVSLAMNSTGSSRWSQLTTANVGKVVAIVLDDIVYTYPRINGPITGGRTQIEGVEADEAQDIVTVLKSGALPAPVNIIEERTVGPSLGAESIEAGTRALLLGFLLVTIFMALYYRTAGLAADVALVLNVLFIFGILAAFRATLTLPGIAGIVLTIGMAVDANVLIFERIREEMASGKTMRAAIDGGFSKALSAIADANITTFLIGVILYSFGVGPIQGFAVTLMAGILTSLFTALVVTRLILEFLTRDRGATVAFG